jgi:hypothetical protein
MHVSSECINTVIINLIALILLCTHHNDVNYGERDLLEENISREKQSLQEKIE